MGGAGHDAGGVRAAWMSSQGPRPAMRRDLVGGALTTRSAVLESPMHNRVELPKSFLQYGLPRTATTLQFITIQACPCALNHTSVKVQKSHKLTWRGAVRANNTTAVFVTSTEGHSKRDTFVLTGHDSTRTHEPWQVEARALENAWDIPHRSIWYVQSVAAVARRGRKIIEDYREIFDLDKEEYGAVVQFMRLWDVLRHVVARKCHWTT
eukprot:scaffold6196_cov75-Phaeocystis_antarctica.AAC.1